VSKLGVRNFDLPYAHVRDIVCISLQTEVVLAFLVIFWYHFMP
jgi:hypothetical protein